MVTYILSCHIFKFASYLPAGLMDRAGFAYEVIAIREGWLTIMHPDFSMEKAGDIIARLVT